jgi:hypothetical protein
LRPTAGSDPGWLRFLAVTAIFGIAYGQFSLFFLAQNEYFFYGLARAGYALIRDDWLAQTSDSWPLFSLLVQFTYRYLDLRLVYVYYIVVLGVYAYALLGIASTLFGVDRTRSRYLAALALLAALHAPIAAFVSRRLFGIALTRELISGVASQRILWEMFQPGAFGALLLLSMHLFLRGRWLAAAVLPPLAAAFNPAYTLTAGALTLSYAIILIRRGEGPLAAARLGLVAFVCIVPVLVYGYVAFRPTDADLWRQAQEILARFRLARHALPGTWLGATAYVKCGVVVAALYAFRRTPIAWVLAVGLFVAAAGTILQVVTGSAALALLYPWRTSVVLVPLASSLLLLRGGQALVDAVERRWPARALVAPVAGVMSVALVAAGIGTTALRFSHRIEGDETAGLIHYVAARRAPNQTYLVPVEWRNFRLFAGVPVFVDYRFVPYNDAAVLEWYHRINVANEFYHTGAELRCEKGRDLAARYGVTHVVMALPIPEGSRRPPRGADHAEAPPATVEAPSPMAACPHWRLLYEDRRSALYSIVD